MEARRVIDARMEGLSRVTRISGRPWRCRSCRARSSTVIVHPRCTDRPGIWEMSVKM
jgi:hypothetical protein